MDTSQRSDGAKKVGWLFILSAAAYNLVSMRNLGLAFV